MEIGKISLHRVKAAEQVSKENKESSKLSSNPFGVSFKGNVIQADVFQSSTKKAATSLTEKGKVFASAVVSGINNFNEAFKSRFNSIIAFGKKITSTVADSLERIGSKEIKFDMEGIKNRIFPDREYSVKNLTNKPVDELRTMWKSLSPEKQAV